MKRSEKKNKSSQNKYFAIESYGVKIKIYTARSEILKEIKERVSKILPTGFYELISPRRAAHSFSSRSNKSFEYVLFKGKQKIEFGNDKEIFLKYLDCQIRLTIAEYAVSRVFLHAGVVGWKGKAIVIPANSFQGKSTLVKEFVTLGAEYYSDEYAVLDEKGYVHPFPKMISLRGKTDKYRQEDFPIEVFGGDIGKVPLPVGLVLLTEYEEGAGWDLQILSEGLGVLEMLSHTIPIRYNPKFSLKVLNKIVNRAIIVKTKRGEANIFALKLLSFLENKV